MNTLLKSTRPSSLVYALAALLLVWAGTAPGRNAATAQGNGSGANAEEFIFGTVGVTPTQTARLNVVNTATSGRAQTRVLKFLDAAGHVIVDSSGSSVMKTVTLAPGQSAYLDLNGADIPGGAGRVQIRALDPTNCGRSCGEAPRSVIQTLELIDNVTHVTDVLYAPAQFLVPEGPPTSPAPFGMVGIAGGQTARLSVTIPPDSMLPEGPPVRVLLGFARANGQPVTSLDGVPKQTVLTLMPGESASFDLSADFILTGGETRAEIRPVLLVPGGCGSCRLIPTLEVIDDATDKTAVLYAPAATRACGGR